MVGRSVLNLIHFDAYPFKNFAKGLSSISASGGYDWPSNMDANGYPTVGSVTTTITGTFVKPSSYTGNWRIKWSGKCKLLISPSQTPNTGVTIISDPGGYGTAGATTLSITATASSYIDFSFNGVGSTVQIQFTSGGDFTGFSNLRIFRTSSPYDGDEADIDSSDPLLQFNDDFLSSIRSLNPSILRMMDATSTNDSNISRYSYFTPVDHLTYRGKRYLPNLWAGDTSGTDTYTCSAATDTPVSWTDGETFQVRFVNANTVTTPTINVNSRGAKTLVRSTGNALAVGGIAANSLATCVYDATLDKVLYYSTGLPAFLPLSIITALCNNLGMDLWFNYPHLLDDSSVTSTATFLRDNLDSYLTHYAELGNETWNFSFPQTTLFKNRGASLGFSSSNSRQEYGYHGLRHRQVMGIITPIWSGRSLKRVMAFQAYGDPSNNDNYRFRGTDLGAYGYDASPDRPIDYSDVLSYAPYYSGAILRNYDANYTGSPALTAGDLSGLTGASDNYATGTQDNIASAFSWIDNDIRAGTCGAGSALGVFTLKYLYTNIYPAWETKAASYSKRVVFYENGYEGIAPSSATCTSLGIDTSYATSIATMLAAYKQSTNFAQLVIDQFKQFMGAFPNDGDYTLFGLLPSSQYPGWYTFSGTIQWSMLTGNLYSAHYASFDGMQLYNNRKRRLRIMT